MTKSKLASVANVETKRMDTIEVREEITPAKAKEWLKQNDACNRNLRDAVVRRYAMDMSAGKWLYTGEAIKFSVGGTLLDGQHRLSAIVRSGATVTMLVVYGLPMESVLAMDSGSRRQTWENITRAPLGMPDPKVVVSWCARARILQGEGVGAPSAETVRQWYEDNKEHVQALLKIRSSNITRIGLASVWGAIAFVRPLNPEKVDAFARKIYRGENLRCDDPVFPLREHLVRTNGSESGNNMEMSLRTLAALRATLEGRRMSRTVAPEGALTWARESIAALKPKAA
jgi:hypothetical protein